MSIVLAAAPHPDDETLGCGGTLLRHRAGGDDIQWLIATRMGAPDYAPDRVSAREREIVRVTEALGFSRVWQLPFLAARLDQVPMAELIREMGRVFREAAPEVVYAPFRTDAHTDHAIVADAVASCAKWFRYPSVRRVLAYETLSETDFSIASNERAFSPNVYVDIAPYLEKKIETMQIYESEMARFPFPRSAEGIRALARVRGAACGSEAAESFVLLRERI